MACLPSDPLWTVWYIEEGCQPTLVSRLKHSVRRPAVGNFPNHYEPGEIKYPMRYPNPVLRTTGFITFKCPRQGNGDVPTPLDARRGSRTYLREEGLSWLKFQTNKKIPFPTWWFLASTESTRITIEGCPSGHHSAIVEVSVVG